LSPQHLCPGGQHTLPPQHAWLGLHLHLGGGGGGGGVVGQHLLGPQHFCPGLQAG